MLPIVIVSTINLHEVLNCPYEVFGLSLDHLLDIISYSDISSLFCALMHVCTTHIHCLKFHTLYSQLHCSMHKIMVACMVTFNYLNTSDFECT